MVKNATKKHAFEINEDLLEWIGQNIYGRAEEEWNLEGENFDPVIEKLIGACASELEKIYDLLRDGAEGRVLNRLAQIMLPDYVNRPFPAHSIAHALPSGSSYVLREEDHFCTVENESNQSPLFFTPLFPLKLVNAEIKFLGTHKNIWEAKKRSRFARVERIGKSPDYISSFLIGLELKDKTSLESLEDVSFYFDLVVRNVPIQTHMFFKTLEESSWQLHQQTLDVKVGFGETDTYEPNQWDYIAQVKQQIGSFYHQYFVKIGNIPLDTQEGNTTPYNNYPPNFFVDNLSEQGKQSLERLLDNVKGRMVWIVVELPYAIKNQNFEDSLQVKLNCFPVVNRKIDIKNDYHTYFNESQLGVIQLCPRNTFLGIDRVFFRQTDEELPFFPYSQFRDKKLSSYTLREGGVGSFDAYNAWERFAFLLSTFRNEFRFNELKSLINSNVGNIPQYGKLLNYKDLIDKLGEKLSIEEIYYLIEEKGLKSTEENLITNENIYLFLNLVLAQKKAGVNVCIRYWVTGTEDANELSIDTTFVAQPAIADLIPDSIRLLRPTKEGQKVKNNIQLQETFRDTLVRRGRIATREDVRSFCHEWIKEEVKVEVKDGIMVDNRPGHGLTRVIEVWIDPTNLREDTNAYWRRICSQLELVLTKQSALILPFTVKLVKK